MTANFYNDNDDLRWYLERGIDWDALVRTTEADFRDPGGPKSVDEALAFYKETLEMVGGFVADEIAPHAAELDRAGRAPTKTARRCSAARSPASSIRSRSSELHGLCVPRELGGMNAPVMLYFLRVRAVRPRRRQRHGAPRLPRRHGDGDAPVQRARGLDEDRPGQGTILETRFARVHRARSCAARRGAAWTSPSPTPAATWRACARAASRTPTATGSSPGRRSSSPRATASTTSSSRAPSRRRRQRPERSAERPDGPVDVPRADLRGRAERAPHAIVGLGRIEEKLGHHASVTAQLDFDRAPAMLVGERGAGLRVHAAAHEQRARSASASSASGSHEAAHRLAAAYAAERKSMGKTIDKHEMIADYLDEMRTDTQALRALCVHGALPRGAGAEEDAHRQVRQAARAPTRRGSSARSSGTSARRAA